MFSLKTEERVRTPWGDAQNSTTVAEGIVFHSTARHGGFYLSEERVKQMPKTMMPSRKRWYEEDCECCLVVLAFPDEFNEKEKAAAHKVVKNYWPERYENHFGVKLTAKDSHRIAEREFRANSVNKMVSVAAWGDWHKECPKGMVLLFAGRGGRRENGEYPPETGYYLVPAEEYEGREGHFIVDEDRHEKVEIERI